MARLAEAYFHLHEYGKAVEWSRNAAHQTVTPRMWGRAMQLAALGHAGDHAKETEQALKYFLERRSDFSITYAREHYPLRIPDAMENFIDGLRKAGGPE